MVSYGEKEVRAHKARKEITGWRGYCHSSKHVQSGL